MNSRRNNAVESLFVRQAPKRGRICLMLGVSLLVHGGIIGIASLWTPPEPEIRSIPFDIFETPGGGGPLPIDLPAKPESSQTPDAVTSPPPENDAIPAPPISTQDPEMEESVKPTPVSHRSTVARSVSATHVAGPQSAPQTGVGRPGNGIPGGPISGPAGAVGAWVTPHPPYPSILLASHATGATTVQITTDMSGRVSNVVILKSAGNPVFDSQTESYVRTHWHGPPNASRTTQFIYQIK